MGKRRSLRVRTAEELKSATARLYAMKGIAQREAAVLRELNQRMGQSKPNGTPKGGGRRPAKQPPRPGGITVGK